MREIYNNYSLFKSKFQLLIKILIKHILLLTNCDFNTKCEIKTCKKKKNKYVNMSMYSTLVLKREMF